MLDKIYHFIMVPMVYSSAAVFVIGVIARSIRIIRSPRQKMTLQIFPEKRPAWLYAFIDTFLLPTVRTIRPVMWVFTMIFHGALVLLVLGHFELIGEFRSLQVVPHRVFLGGGFVGLALTLSLLFFLFSRFRTPYREISVSEDYFLLLLLLATVLSGSHMDWAKYLSPAGFDIPVAGYREYLSSLFSTRPDVPPSIAGSPHYVLVALHIFFANLFLLFFPFSKIMHTFFALPLNLMRRGGLHGANTAQ
jgi:nitrate reductase gamma subunit